MKKKGRCFCLLPGYKAILLTVIGLLSRPAFSDAQNIQFRHLDVSDGLSNNQVNSILKDRQGFMWFATASGLNRYDGHTLRVFRHVPDQQGSLSDNTVNLLSQGPDDQLWVKTGLGYNVYNPENESFIRNTDSLLSTMEIPAGDIVDVRSDESSTAWFLHENRSLYAYRSADKLTRKYIPTHSAPPSAIATGKKSTTWIVYQDGMVEAINSETLQRVEARQIPFPKTSSFAEYQIFIDNNDDLWIYSRNLPAGVYWWATRTGTLKHFSRSSDQEKLNNDLVRSIAQDAQGRIWFATDHGGINLYDPASGSIRYVQHDEYDERSLVHNSTISLYSDRSGTVWAGTFKHGISFYHPNVELFPIYKHNRANPNSLPFGDVNCFVEDNKENLWIGTNGGGLVHFDKHRNTFRQYLNRPGQSNSLSSNIIVSLQLDKSGQLWIGTYHGGLNRFDGQNFYQYQYNPADSTSISDNSVWELLIDSRGRFWVGTLSSGLDLMDLNTGKFTHIGYGKPGKSPGSPYISALTEDSKGNIWIGTASGIDVLDQKGDYKRLQHDRDVPASLSNDYVIDILEDRNRRIWVATRDGLNLVCHHLRVLYSGCCFSCSWNCFPARQK